MITTTQEPPAIDYYRKAEAPVASAATTIEDLIEAVRSDEYKEPVVRLRQMLANGDEDGYSEAKRSLPAVSISGACDGRRKAAVAEGRFKHSGFIQIDLDGKDNVGWSVEEIREILQAEPRIVAAFVSPGGDGVKGIARVPADPATHLGSFIAARNHFKSFNLTIDEACKDPVRLCFVSYDPSAWVDLSREAVFEPVVVPATAPVMSFPVKNGGLILREKHGSFPAPPQSGIHTWLMQAAWWCRLNDMSEAETVERLRSYDGSLRRPLQATEAVDAARSVFTRPLANPDWKIEQQVAAMLATPAGGSTMQAFDPEDVYYDGPASKYLVRIGNAFFTYSLAAPIITGVTRHLADQYPDAKELMRAVKAAVASRQLDGGIQWSGSIAGHRQGMSKDADGLPMLITREAKPPEPVPGEFPVINDLLGQAFANETALLVFMSWMAGRYRAVRSHTHIPSPMLVIAGEVNSGKSLLAWIVSQLLGGRTANPYSAWSNAMLWNDDLVGSELLLVDDCTPNTDFRQRRAFGAAFKEAMYPHIVQLRKRHASAISVRPVWACMVCCNDTPEALQIIPPLDADMADKIILLHCSPVKVPIDTSSPEGRHQLQKMVRAELSAFAAELLEWETPEDLRDSRSGVLAWRDPSLVSSVEENSPARLLERLLEMGIEHMGIWHDLPRELTAMEIESRLTDMGSPVRDRAKQMFSWHGACGSALARLAKKGGALVSLGGFDSHRKIQRFIIDPKNPDRNPA